MFLQHVRTRLDRQRNYFRIYMISHALISDSVDCTHTFTREILIEVCIYIYIFSDFNEREREDDGARRAGGARVRC